jgi:hypothetical protein
MRTFKQQHGFSLIEVFFSVAILAVVIFSFYKLPVFFSKSEKSVSTIVTRDRLFKSFSQNFISIAERSDVAARFQNLPVSTTCAPNKPCVRLLEEKDKSFSFKDINLDSLPSVQFLRDEKGELVGRPLWPEKDVKLLTREPFVFEREILEKEYYATWPLVDESSEPFVLMRRGDVADHFMMEEAFMTSLPSSNWMVVKGTRKGIDLTKVIGHPMLIYNMEDLSQFTAQRVTEALDCSLNENKNRCHDAAKALNVSFNPDEPKYDVTGGETAKKFDEMPFYLFDLQPFKESELRFENGAQANDLLNRKRNFLPNPGLAPSTWAGGQDSAIYIFPTEVASFYGPGLTDLQKPVDGKRLGHFNHMLPTDQRGTYALLPFDLISYQMEDLWVKNSSGVKEKDKAGRKVLTLHTLGSNSSEVALADIEKGDQIIFARRLGRAELSVYHLK